MQHEKHWGRSRDSDVKDFNIQVHKCMAKPFMIFKIWLKISEVIPKKNVQSDGLSHDVGV